MEETIQYLQIITNVIIILLFIGLLITVFYLVKMLKMTAGKVEELSSQVKDIKIRIDPVIEKFNTVAENVNVILNSVKDNIDVLQTSVTKINSVVDNLVEFEKKVQSKIEPPVLETANTIAALSAGIKTFFENYKNSRERKISINSEIDFSPEKESESGVSERPDMELQNVNEKLNDLQN